MIEVESLSKIYGSCVAIDALTFRVEAGETLGFLGPNGAGKTTTMRILAGAIPPSAGTARIAGFDIQEQSMAVKKRLGFLPENPPLYPNMSVRGFLHFVATIKGVSAGDRPNRVNWVLERCQLQEYSRVLISKLSKGYRQRVGIAQAIVHRPPVIILDEPTVGLDPLQIIEVRHLIRSLGGDHTVILSTHILPEVSMTCDRVVIINRGKVVATATLDNLMREFASRFTYTIELDGFTEDLLSLLRQVPGVSQASIDSQFSVASRTLLQVTCQPNSEPGDQIAALIVTQGLSLYEMRRSRPTLEDVFLELLAKSG
ncbi:ABC transporter ATP-binding protein [Gloeocapsa sp. PCC 73106]|uniref:ABC transporter ATP-binding protein n=1 Tax=Gloeocapsa sp. PCC 73106 TaxID=102232 RepID=UPI0002ACB652|nr:ABC transporter ATP-binding protein [Gloeocapsa sp. PCC 73106]ELR97517.1 ABC-type multidrug transport system, ATPase component [Gloeocapsa sp. PCC 73106]